MQHGHKLDRLGIRIKETVQLGINFFGINSKRWPSRITAKKFQSVVSFPVFQSTNENDYWSKMGGMKDDIFVYDRCGLLAYYVPFPSSHIPDRFVEAAILLAHFESP